MLIFQLSYLLLVLSRSSKSMELLLICTKNLGTWKIEKCIQFLSILQRLWFFFLKTSTLYGWKFQNATPPTIFIWFEPNLMMNILITRKRKHWPWHFLAACEILEILWYFEILTWESMGNPKIYDISLEWLFEERNRGKFGARTWFCGA